MSKLLDSLEKAAQGAVNPIGFGVSKTQAAQPSSLLLLASLSEAGVNKAKLAIKKGADALLIRIKDLGEATKLVPTIAAAGDIPCGVALTEVKGQIPKNVEELGLDFFVFQAEGSTCEVLRSEKSAKVLEVESSLDDGLLETIDDLPIDAVFLKAGDAPFLNIHQLMIYQRVVNHLSKPIIVAVPPNLKDGDLELVRDRGIGAVLIDDALDKFGERIHSLRQAIDALPSPNKKKQSKLDVLVPPPKTQASAPEEYEDD